LSHSISPRGLAGATDNTDKEDLLPVDRCATSPTLPADLYYACFVLHRDGPEALRRLEALHPPRRHPRAAHR
jgi:hypothetical protein